MSRIYQIIPFLLLFSFSCRTIVASDMIPYPDGQTLWIQRNDEFLWGEDSWRAAPNTFEVVPSEDGLRITAPAALEGGMPSILRYVPFDPDHPWLQFDISDVSVLEGYRAFTVTPVNLDTFKRNSVVRLQEGRYVTRLTPGKEAKADARGFQLQIGISGFQLVLKDLCMKIDPLPRLEAHPVDTAKEIPEIGDKMNVTVYLAEPAEDVSVELFNRYLGHNLSLGGAGSLQLKPTDAEGKVWSGTFVLEQMNVKPIPMGEPVPPGHLLFKAIILGGNFPEPLLTWNEHPWNVNP